MDTHQYSKKGPETLRSKFPTKGLWPSGLVIYQWLQYSTDPSISRHSHEGSLAFDKFSFFPDSPQVQYLVTGSESGSETESETETTHLLVPSSGRCTTAVGSQRIEYSIVKA